MKRGLVFEIVLSFLALTGFASASYFSDTLSFIDPTLITLAILFVVIFAVLYFSTSKIFKGQTKIAAVISIALALLAVYWINNSANLGQLFAGFGISDENLYTIGSLLFLALTIFLAVKLKFGVLLIIGGILILAGVTNLVASTDLAIIIGIVLVVIGAVLWIKKKGKGPKEISPGNNPSSVYNTHNVHNYYNKVEQEKKDVRNKDKTRGEEIDFLKGKARADANIAMANERAKQEQQQKLIGQERNEQRQIEQQERGLISTDINSLMNSYKALEQTYNEIYHQDPSNPRLRDLMTDMIRIRDEMIRIKRGQK